VENLSVREIQELLDAASIDYRDCIEKKELVQRLESHKDNLPRHLKRHLSKALRHYDSNGDFQVPPPHPPSELYNQRGLLPEEQNTVSMFKRCAPSVVNITSMASARLSPFAMDETQVPAGTGSGVVWDADGHIVTNFHVIQKASTCAITFSNNVTREARVVGTEPDKDLAVLRLANRSQDTLSPRLVARTQDKLTPIMVGSSQMLEVGQSVFAIGNPFGLDQTLTSGLVSGLGRQVKGVTGRVIRDVVQTDAAINPGNSGGPLLDSQGRLIGINTMIYSPSGASVGVGFAIPSDTVRRVVNQIVRHGRVIRPSLGLMIFDDRVSRQLGLRGVLIQSVLPGSGSDDAGLLGTRKHPSTGELILGDEIEAVGGQIVCTKEDLIAAIEVFNVGDLVLLGIRRANKSLDINVRLKHAAAE